MHTHLLHNLLSHLLIHLQCSQVFVGGSLKLHDTVVGTATNGKNNAIIIIIIIIIIM